MNWTDTSDSFVNKLDHAAINHTSCTVKKREPQVGKVVFRKSTVFDKSNGTLQIEIVDSPIGYPPDKLYEMGKMIHVLQLEGKLGVSDTIPVEYLYEMSAKIF